MYPRPPPVGPQYYFQVVIYIVNWGKTVFSFQSLMISWYILGDQKRPESVIAALNRVENRGSPR